ncbi:hypothetical protein EHS25_009706 [Saitozyma podzolica]|uniref:Uncharacterized protein n=1 Tax=Saitozyma podzolica TaxID=1890683 RepID=A0A427YK04_9TREE|nr:hypothetical protein EHS25_009706 [Saitozyma podzolica]
MPPTRPSSGSSSTRRRVDFWTSLDRADRSGDLLETDEEAAAFDERVREEIQWKEHLHLPRADTSAPSSSSPAAAVLDAPAVERSQRDLQSSDGEGLVFGLDHVTDEPAEMGASAILDAPDPNRPLPPAPSFRPADIHTSTPSHPHSASFPAIPSPSHHTTPLPAPPVLPTHRASTAALHALRRTIETLLQ